MGYVHDTEMAVPIPVGAFQFVTGTWADGVASNVWTKNKTATDEAATIRIPIPLPLQNANAYKGCQLKSVTMYFSVATAALDALSAAMYKQTLAVDGAAPVIAAVTTSYDTGHDTAAERIDVDDHTMTLTVTTPPWVDDGEHYFVEISCDAAATSVFKIGDAVAYFNVRA